MQFLELNESSTYIQTAKSANAVVTLAEVKAYLKITTATQDALIQTFIDAAVSFAEKCMSRDILTTTYQNYRESFFSDLTLKRGAFQSLVSIEILIDSVYEVLAATEYTVKIGGIFGVICEVTEPSNVDCDCNAIRITFKTGFGDDETSVPADIKIAIMQIVMFLDQNRGDCSCSDETIPPAARTIFEKYRIINTG